MDVLGVAWSPDGALASCSVDNTVMIWDIVSPALAGNSVGVRGGVLAPRVTLRGHASFVKGVAFDPVGRLLASCGADDVVIIWSTETWAEVARITEPLKDSVDNTIFRRIDWAPDGGSLCLSAAVKACKPLAAVIQRSTWSCVADLVGHDVATTCARFHGKLVVADDAGGSGGGGARAVPSCVVAVGDQRGVVSIWTTRKNVPLVVIKDIFSDAIVDMSWSSLPAGSDTGRGGDGAVLGMCSLDGTVALVEIDRPEGKQRNSSLLGKEITGSALEDHFVRMYGKKLEDLLSSNPRSSLPAAAKSKIKVLAAHKNALAPVAVMYPSQSTSSIRSLSVKSSAPSLSMSSPSTATPSLNAAFGASAISRSTTSTPVIPDKTVPGPALVRQAESRRASDGKKRITPVALDAPGSSSSSSSHEMTMDTSLKRTRVSFQDSASPSFSSGGMDSTRDDNILEKRPSSIAPCTIQGADISSTTPEESAKSDRPIGLGVSTPLPSAVTSAINAASTGNDSSRSRPMADRLGPDLNLKSGEILYAFKSDTLFSRSWVQTLGAEASGSIWQDIFQSSYCSEFGYIIVIIEIHLE
jgi:protein HIRA/HIR1